ncbi:Sodium/calcium exchanger protein-domain-containing protein [Xylaria venustula]|nr:Sodium/calcium exchanger protein-domain-containing protein [Xylaria venustula]
MNLFHLFHSAMPWRANTLDMHATDTPQNLQASPDHNNQKGQFTLENQVRRTLFGGWINVLLLAAPAGIVIWALKVPGPAVFIVNFIAIIPLAAMISYATEQIALRTGDVGNAVELIIAVIALTENRITVVQTSLVGSILSNLLLVLGFCFFFGGINRLEQHLNTTVAQTATSLLALSIASLILPAIFSYKTPLPSHTISQLSRGIAIILLLVYLSYLFFQIKTHRAVFDDKSIERATQDIFEGQPRVSEDGATSEIIDSTSAALDVETGQTSRRGLSLDRSGPEEPELHFLVALGTLILCTVIVALCAEGLVSGIEPISSVVSEEFIGLILIPIVGNACEHATAVTAAIKNKINLAVSIAIGSSIQVSLFLIPLLIIIGWGIGSQEITLAFDTFQVIVFFIAVLLNYSISDGKSHWLKGVELVSLYVIIAVCAFCKSGQSQRKEMSNANTK